MTSNYCVAWWRSSRLLDLQLEGCLVEIPADPLLSATLDMLLTHMCLCHQAV